MPPPLSIMANSKSGHAADSKLRYTIQFSILMLCAKYQEAGLCGSREKCDRNYLMSKFAYIHNIQSPVKQEVDMPQIHKCVTRYSSPYGCSVPNIRKLASVVPENKRPMGHIAHLRKQFKSINTYDNIITLIKKRKKKPL